VFERTLSLTYLVLPHITPTWSYSE